VCVLVPTFTYIVYANYVRSVTNDAYRARVEAWGARPYNPDEHPDYALSTYNFHRDGSGIAYSSRLRPIMNMRSGFLAYHDPFGSGLRHYPADTHLYDWLEAKGHTFDVLTDEEFAPVVKELSAIRWTTFTDNFLMVKAGEQFLDNGDPGRMDWFDDDQWDTICHNIRVLTRVAVAARCKGLGFDPEPYHASVWNYDQAGSRKPYRGSPWAVRHASMTHREFRRADARASRKEGSHV